MAAPGLTEDVPVAHGGTDSVSNKDGKDIRGYVAED